MRFTDTGNIQDEERRRSIAHYEMELAINALQEREEHAFEETWHQYGELAGSDPTVANVVERAADRLVSAAEELIRRSEGLRPVPFPTARLHTALHRVRSDWRVWAEATASAVRATVEGGDVDWASVRTAQEEVPKSRGKADSEEKKFLKRLNISPELRQNLLNEARANIEADRWVPRARPRFVRDTAVPVSRTRTPAEARRGNDTATTFEEAIESLAGKLVAGSLAIVEQPGRDELKGITVQLQGVNWGAIAMEYLLLSIHLMDRYSIGLYGPDIREKIMRKLGIRIITGATQSGSLPIDDLGAFYNLFMATLRRREAAYNRLKLDSVLREEISMALDGIAVDDRQRLEELAHYFLTEKDVAAIQLGDQPERQNSLLWQFTGRIAFLLGQPDSPKVIAHIHNFTIDNLLIAINPVRELERIRSALETGSTV